MARKKSERKDTLGALVEEIRPEYEKRAVKVLSEQPTTEAIREHNERQGRRGSPLSGAYGDAHGDALFRLAVELTAKHFGHEVSDEVEEVAPE